MTPQMIDRLSNSSDETALQDLEQTMHHAVVARPNGDETPPQQNKLRHVPVGTGPAYWGPGELMTFLITGEETNGAFFMAEISVSPGGGTPPHIHSREDESFHLLEGMLTIQVGGDTITASAGDFVYLPRGIAHSFKNTGHGCAKAVVLTTPAGLEGFFAEVFEPAADRSAPPPPASKELIDRALAAGPRYGLELLPQGITGSITIHETMCKKEVSMSLQSINPCVNPADETIRLGPIEVRFLITGENSSGTVAVFEAVVPAAQRLTAPAHSHDHYEETVYGIDGVLTWTVDDKLIDVGPGQALCIPRGAVHRFDNNGSEDVKALCVVTPAALGPQYFREAAEVIKAAAGGPPDRAKMVEIMLRHGLTPVPPPGQA